jgi:hypothetical protein
MMTLAKLLPFLRASGLFEGWPDELLLAFCARRAALGQLVVVADGLGEPAGALAWHTAPTPEGLRVSYREPGPADAYVYGDFLVSRGWQWSAQLAQRFMVCQPRWRQMVYVGHRRADKRLVRYVPEKLVGRFARGMTACTGRNN